MRWKAARGVLAWHFFNNDKWGGMVRKNERGQWLCCDDKSYMPWVHWAFQTRWEYKTAWGAASALLKAVGR